MYDSFEQLRDDVLREAKERKENIIKKWLDDIGYTEWLGYSDPVGYYFDSSNKTVEIFSTRPGVLIGKFGINVQKFKDILSEEFHEEWKVNFVEIRGGFVNVNHKE